MNPFDSYMLNKVRQLKDVRTRYVATDERSLLVQDAPLAVRHELADVLWVNLSR